MPLCRWTSPGVTQVHLLYRGSVSVSQQMTQARVLFCSTQQHRSATTSLHFTCSPRLTVTHHYPQCLCSGHLHLCTSKTSSSPRRSTCLGCYPACLCGNPLYHRNPGLPCVLLRYSACLCSGCRPLTHFFLLVLLLLIQ